jgi:hypothetical protein
MFFKHPVTPEARGLHVGDVDDLVSLRVINATMWSVCLFAEEIALDVCLRVERPPRVMQRTPAGTYLS